MTDNGSLQEAQVHVISTRSVDDLVKAIGVGGMSKNQVTLGMDLLNRGGEVLSPERSGSWNEGKRSLSADAGWPPLFSPSPVLALTSNFNGLSSAKPITP
jgi:hypothetical protein